jgi:hypothetical protein
MDRKLEQLGEQIAEQAAHFDAALHQLLADQREFDARGGWYVQGATSCAHWLAWRVGWDLVTARERVRVARKLADFARIDDALRRGEVSYSKVRAMLRVATPANEAMLLDAARLMTASHLEKLSRKYALVQRHGQDANPRDDEQRRYLRRRDTEDGMVKIETVLHPEEAELLWTALNHIAARQTGDSAGSRDSQANPQVSSNIMHRTDTSAFDASARITGDSAELSGPPSQGVPQRPLSVLQQRETSAKRAFNRANALMSLAQYYVHGERPHRTPVEIVVAVPVSILRSGVGATPTDPINPDDPIRNDGPIGVVESAYTPDPIRAAGPVRAQDALCAADPARAREPIRAGDPIRTAAPVCSDDPIDVGEVGSSFVSAKTARRLSCDAGVIEVIEDDQGAPLSVGRKRRTITGALKRALYKRDSTCTFPGCTHSVFLEGHHIRHWADGGATSLDNTALLCTTHHRYVHEYSYTIELGPDHRPRFRDPRGRPVAPVPTPPKALDLGWPHLRAANAALAIDADTIACEWDGTQVDYGAVVSGLATVDRLQ